MKTPPTSFERMRMNTARRREKSDATKEHLALEAQKERELNKMAHDRGMVIPRPKRWLADGLNTWPGFPDPGNLRNGRA